MHSVLPSYIICISKTHSAMQNHAVKTTELMGEMGLGTQHSKSLSVTS